MSGKRRGNAEEESERRAEGGPGRASRDQEEPEDNQNELGEDREFLNSAPFPPVLALGTSSLYLPGK